MNIHVKQTVYTYSLS